MALSTSALLEKRRLRGWSQTRMGDAAGISRQSYAAIESGRSVPSTEVALRLARALGTSVEELFRLPDPDPAEVVVASGTVGPDTGAGAGVGRSESESERFVGRERRIRVARIAGREIGYPLDAGGPHGQHLADGTGVRLPGGRIRVRLLAERPPAPDLVVAGCDPAFGLVADHLRRENGLEVLWLPAGSRASLDLLARGSAHVAGVHLRDSDSGSYNGPWIRRLVPFPATRIGFAVWEQALLLAGGNPLGIEGVADLARPGLRFLNREPGSGSRALLELRLEEAGIPVGAVPGFLETAADGHWTVGGAVAAGAADAGVAIGAVARARSLHRVSLGEEPYELVIPTHFVDLPPVAALLRALRRPALRHQVEALGGYDGAGMGQPV